jgi:hypothetical protein
MPNNSGTFMTPEMQASLSKPVSELFAHLPRELHFNGAAVRLVNLLEARVSTIGELLFLKISDLRGMPNFGPASERYLFDALACMGFKRYLSTKGQEK